jgi:uncharacterized DUF497 family protein
MLYQKEGSRASSRSVLVKCITKRYNRVYEKVWQAIDLRWDANNIGHLWRSHGVTPDEVEEALLGFDREDPYLLRVRDGDYHAFLGRTGGGRLLSMVGEYLDDGGMYIFSARNMNAREKNRYRR